MDGAVTLDELIHGPKAVLEWILTSMSAMAFADAEKQKAASRNSIYTGGH